MALPVRHYHYDSSTRYACGVRINKKREAVDDPQFLQPFASRTSRGCLSCMRAIESAEVKGSYGRRGKRK